MNRKEVATVPRAGMGATKGEAIHEIPRRGHQAQFVLVRVFRGSLIL
ncbi:MAG: hypothetical protein H7Z16_17220 [Pyrinomonadaceae bacterium]|nr:hypothetical protein [Pyrinomonadaceae bacterium]